MWPGRKGSANLQGGTEKDHPGRHCNTFISFSVLLQINTAYYYWDSTGGAPVGTTTSFTSGIITPKIGLSCPDQAESPEI